ncbi:MAG: metallopeptidase family protein [Chloroflexota bacterium]
MTAADRLRAARGIRHRYRTDRRTFERIVSEVVSSLPEQFRARLDNLAIIVAEWPTDEDNDVGVRQRGVEPDEATDLLGLYQGVPYGERMRGYHLAVPDQITIYRQPILAACRSEAEVREEIRQTVLHEIGHYFGLDEHELP